MEENKEIKEEDFWKTKIKKHINAFIIAVIAGAIAIIGAVIVLIWFINTSNFGAQGTASFNDWTIAWIWGFFFFLILWELLFVGIAAAVFFGVGGYLWWKKLSDDEKQEFKDHRKKEKKRRGGGAGGSFFMFVAYTVYLAVQGELHTTFGTYSYSYWIFAYLWTIAWILIVLGIPAAIIIIVVYFVKWRKET